MGWVNTDLRVQPTHRAEVVRLLGVETGDADEAIAAIEDAYQVAAAIQDDLVEDDGPDPGALDSVRELAGELTDALRDLDYDTRDHLEQRYWGAKMRPNDPDVPIRGTAHVSLKDLEAAIRRLRDAAAPHERRGRRRKEEDRILVASLADIWERYRGDRPEWKPREGAGEFGVFANFVATRAIRWRSGSLDRSIRDVLED